MGWGTKEKLAAKFRKRMIMGLSSVRFEGTRRGALVGSGNPTLEPVIVWSFTEIFAASRFETKITTHIGNKPC